MTLLALFGIVFIAYFSSQLNIYLHRRVNDSFKASFAKASLLIAEKLNSYIHGLQGINGVYLVTDFKPGNTRVRKYAEQRNFFNNFPGTMGFGFIRRVPHSDLSTYLSNTKKMIPNFKLHSAGPLSFKDHYVIEAIEPIEKNAPAIGLDISTETNRFETARKSIELGVPILTAPVVLVQIQQTGFLFLAPSYSTGVPPKIISERKEKHIGWAYSVILASAIKEYLRKFVDQRLILNIFDGDEVILRDNRKMDSFFKDPQEIYKINVSIGGRVWSITGATVENPNAGLIDSLTFSGFLVVSILFLLLHFQVYRMSIKSDLTKAKAFDLENWQKAILDSSTFSIISTDVNGKITTFNKSAENLIGYTSEQVVGIHTPALFHDLEEVQRYTVELEKKHGIIVEPGFETFVAKARLTGSDLNEWSYVTSTGRKIPVRLSVTVLRDANDTVIGFLGLAENLSEIKEIQKALVTSAKMSALGEMASGIAHEINNPLAIISGRASLLKMALRQMNNSQVNETDSHLKVIDETITRIAEIIKGLKVFSRESSKDDMVLTPLNKILADTHQLCNHRLINKQIELKLVGDLDLNIQCRSVQLSQVFMNLISNSIDALEELPTKWIRIEVKKIGSMACIYFSDSGLGISDEIAEKILQPFFSTKEVGKGTGLGLSISKGILESHGGSLNYEAKSKNTTFKILLPLDE